MTGSTATKPLVQRVPDVLAARLGSHERAWTIALLAAVVGLESADAGAVGAVAKEIESAFGVGRASIGLVASASLIVGAVGTIPFGALADRVVRVRVLGIVVALWSVAMIATGAAQSYTWLLVSRLGLGVVTAAALPMIASLIGDFFHPEERGRIYGLVLTGEYVGTAIGLLVCGTAGAAVSWRFAFWVLAPPGLVLAWLLLRRLPEPARGGAGRLDAANVSADDGDVRRVARENRIEPDAARVLRDRAPSLRQAVSWTLRTPTNVTLIVASALAYFFIAGMKTFAVSLLREDFGVQQAVAVMLLMLVGAAALAGVIAGGRAGDRLIQRGRMNARVMVPAVAYAAGAALLAPGFLVASLPIAVVFFALGGAALAAGNAPLDAARLDIMPSFLWGRAEAVRAVLRQTAQAIAPLTFGLLADVFGNGTNRGGLRLASLVMLVTLVASAAVTWHARRSYARDVATAIASEADAGERDA